MFRLASVLAIVLAATAAQSEITTSHVHVRVNGLRCHELHEVFLVMDGDDGEEKWIALEPAGSCLWTKNLGEGRRFSTKLSSFSLRVDFARTDCHQAIPNETELVGELEFDCCNNGPLHDIEVKTKPETMPVSYMRNVPQKRDSVECKEGSPFVAGARAIRKTQFTAESVYLQLGMPKPNRRMRGLLLNDVAVGGSTLFLDRNGVTYRLTLQRGHGRGGVSPTLSSNAISVDVEQLGELKFESTQFIAK